MIAEPEASIGRLKGRLVLGSKGDVADAAASVAVVAAGGVYVVVGDATSNGRTGPAADVDEPERAPAGRRSADEPAATTGSD